MSDHGDAGEDEEAFHENCMKLLSLSVRKSRKTSVFIHITVLGNTHQATMRDSANGSAHHSLAEKPAFVRRHRLSLPARTRPPDAPAVSELEIRIRVTDTRPNGRYRLTRPNHRFPHPSISSAAIRTGSIVGRGCRRKRWIIFQHVGAEQGFVDTLVTGLAAHLVGVAKRALAVLRQNVAEAFDHAV